MNPAARLAELDAVHARIIERTADQLTEEGASTTAARLNKRSRVKRARAGSGLRDEARRRAEDYLGSLADARPDDPTVQQYARLMSERESLREMVNALAEYSLGGAVPRELARLEAAARLELVGLSEIAELLGVSRQRVHQLHGAGRMPAELGRTSAGPVWNLRELEEWARERKVSRETSNERTACPE